MWIYVVFILHSIIISSSHSSASNLKKEDNWMIKICKRTRNFKICYGYWYRVDAQSLNGDVKGLARIILEQAQRDANSTMEDVTIYTGEQVPSQYPMEKKCRGDIHRLMYGLLLEAIRSLDSNDYGGAKKSIQNAADIANACKDQLARSGHVALRKRAGHSFKLVHSLCLVALDIISTMV